MTQGRRGERGGGEAARALEWFGFSWRTRVRSEMAPSRSPTWAVAGERRGEGG